MVGKRDPESLATQRDRRLRANEQTVVHSRHGNRREEHRFALAQALAHDDFLETTFLDSLYPDKEFKNK